MLRSSLSRQNSGNFIKSVAQLTLGINQQINSLFNLQRPNRIPLDKTVENWVVETLRDIEALLKSTAITNKIDKTERSILFRSRSMEGVEFPNNCTLSPIKKMPKREFQMGEIIPLLKPNFRDDKVKEFKPPRLERTVEWSNEIKRYQETLCSSIPENVTLEKHQLQSYSSSPTPVIKGSQSMQRIINSNQLCIEIVRSIRDGLSPQKSKVIK